MREVEQIVVFLIDVTGLQTFEEHRRVDAGSRLSLKVKRRRGKSCIAGAGSMAEGWSPGEPEVEVGQKGSLGGQCRHGSWREKEFEGGASALDGADSTFRRMREANRWRRQRFGLSSRSSALPRRKWWSLCRR